MSHERHQITGWPDLTILSIGLWDMLHIRDLHAYRVELQHIVRLLVRPRPDAWADGTSQTLWWVSSPSLQNEKLSPNKKLYMSNSLATSYNAAAVDVLACGQFAQSAGHVDGVVDLQGLTSNDSSINPVTVDGIHYSDAAYDMAAFAIAAAAS